MKDNLASLFPQKPDLKSEIQLIASFFKLAGKGDEETARSLDLDFLAMAVEAYRQEIITYAKLLELAKTMNLTSETISELLSAMGFEEEVEDKVYLPE